MTSPNYSVVKAIFINKRGARRRNCIMHIRGTEFDIGANKTFFKLAALGFSAKGDLRLKINYLTDLKDWMPVYNTDQEKNQKKAPVQWKEFYLSRSKFGNDENAQLKIEVEEFSKTKGSNLLGEIEVTLM